jgi:hypothetical protein
MAMIGWILLFWLLGSVAVAFFAMCLIRGGATHENEQPALEPKAADDASKRAAVA